MGWKRGSGFVIRRVGSRARTKLWALSGVGEGLRVLVGSESGMGEVEGGTLEWGKELWCVLSTKCGSFSRMWKQRP